MADGRRQDRFHGRTPRDAPCAHPGCAEPGEFRAPSGRRGGSDGPGEWRWLCLDHVRAFNGGYNFFEGMSTDEIDAAQRPYAGWERETRAFGIAGVGGTPRWADYIDPLDAIGAKFGQRIRPREDGKPLSDADRRALKTLGLEPDADRRSLRERYAELVRRYHPDRNGGDRGHEAALRETIAAYQHLRKAAAFA